MSDDQVFGFDVACRDALVEILVEMTDCNSEREKVLDTLRIMMLGQLQTLERIRREQAASAPVAAAALALVGQPLSSQLDLECRTAAFLAEVMTKTCQAFTATNINPGRLQ